MTLACEDAVTAGPTSLRFFLEILSDDGLKYLVALTISIPIVCSCNKCNIDRHTAKNGLCTTVKKIFSYIRANNREKQRLGPASVIVVTNCSCTPQTDD